MGTTWRIEYWSATGKPGKQLATYTNYGRDNNYIIEDQYCSYNLFIGDGQQDKENKMMAKKGKPGRSRQNMKAKSKVNKWKKQGRQRTIREYFNQYSQQLLSGTSQY